MGRTAPTDTTPLISNDSLLSSYQIINDIIERSKENNSLEETQEHPFWYYLKFVFAIFLLVGRVLSCLFRYVTTKDMTQFWTSSTAAIEAVGGIFALADMIMTVLGSKKSVLRLCLTPHWFQKIKENIRVCQCNAQLLCFFILILLSLPGPFLKAKVGVLSITDHIQKENTGFNALAYFSGISSAICFLAFQINQQMRCVIRTRENLNNLDNKAHWDKFCELENKLLLKNRIIGILLALTNAAMTATSVFYDAGSFEIHSGSGIRLGVFFGLIAASTAIMNFMYVSNPVYLFWCIQDNYNTLLAERADRHDLNEEGTSPVKALLSKMIAWIIALGKLEKESEFSFQLFLLKIICFIAVIGGGIAMGPSIIHALMAITQSSSVYGGHYCVGIFGALLTAGIIPSIFVRDYTMWARKYFAERCQSTSSSSQPTHIPIIQSSESRIFSAAAV